MLRVLALAIVIGVNGWAGGAAASKRSVQCPGTSATIIYDKSVDRELGCKGVQRALGFFASYGVEADESLRIIFQAKVMAPVSIDAMGNPVLERVYGYYSREDQTVYMSSRDTTYAQQRTAFEYLPLTEEFHTSIVAHEVAHWIHHLISEKNGRPMKHGTSEYLAYVVQIATMNPLAQQELLKLWPEKILVSSRQINSVVWAAAPHRFGVMSYRYFVQNPEIVSKIINGEFSDPDLDLELML